MLAKLSNNKDKNFTFKTHRVTIFFYELECLYEEPRHVATDSKLMGDSDRERYVTQALNLGLLTFGSMIDVYDQQDFRI